MNVKAKILVSEQVEYESGRFVKLQGFINGLGVFTTTVKEELVPDFLEGKECVLMFSLGLDQFKKFKLNLKGISLDTSKIEE